MKARPVWIAFLLASAALPAQGEAAAQAALTQAQEALAKGERDTARAQLVGALDALDRADADRKQSSAMQLRWRCGQMAWDLDDKVGRRAWEDVLRYYQQADAALLADPPQLAAFQQARALLAALREKEITPAGFDAGERLRRDALATWEKAGAKAEAALARAQLGQSLVQRGIATSEKGRKELQQAYDEIRRERPDSDEMAQIARLYANALVDMGQEHSPLTLDLQQAAFRIWQQHPPADADELLGLKWEMANTLFKNGDLVASRRLAQESFEGAMTLHADAALQTYWPRSFYAMVLRAMGDGGLAAKMLEQNVDICKKHCPPKDSTLMHAWLNVGYLAWVQGHPDDAIKAFEQSEQAIVPADRTALALGNVALLYDNLAQCYADKGNSKKAIELLTKALTFCKGPVAQAQIRGGMAMARQRDGRPDQLKAAADEFEKSVPLVVATQGYEQAVLYLSRQALTLAELNDARLAKCLQSLMVVARKGTQECYTLPGRPSHQLAEIVDEAAALVLALAKGAGSAQKQLEQQAFGLLETLRGVDLRVVGLARRWQAAPAIVELRERAGKARADLARLASLGEGTSDQVLMAAAARDEQEFKALYAALQGAAPDGVVEVTIEALAAALPPDGAAVAFRMLSLRRPDPKAPRREAVDLRFEAHVVTKGKDGKGRFERIVLGDPTDMRATATAWREQILAGVHRGRDPQNKQVPDHAATLAKLVFEPLKPALGGVKKLVVCLDDELHRVPLELVPGFRDLELSFTVSLVDLLAKPARQSPSESLFAIGGIDFDGAAGGPAASGATSTPADGSGARGMGLAWGAEAKVSETSFGPLPGTAKEVAAIADAFRKAFQREPEVLTDRAVTREAFIANAEKAGVLALATHGYFLDAPKENASDRDTAMRGFAPMALCGLALSGANLTGRPGHEGHLGVITAEEIAGLDLSGCRLATLSACQSYLGEARRGHGLASLQGALHAAGVRVVIAARWPITDDAATELMTAFYRRLWLERLSPRKALAAAKAQVSADSRWQAPKFWAGFVLTGDVADPPR